MSTTTDRKPQHTPGPWRFDGRQIISEVTNDQIHHLVDDATYKANETLKAAAPDLLAACQEVLRWADTPANQSGTFAPYSFITKARAAIAKATATETEPQ